MEYDVPKFYVGQGTGGLYVNPKIKLKPVILGGTGSRSFETIHPTFMPDVLEAGTLNTPGIAGLGAAVEWIMKTGPDVICRKKEFLVNRLYEKLSINSNIKFYSLNDTHNSGIVSFIIKGMDSSDIANTLDSRYSIACRAGFHCAPLAHKHLKTEKTGLVRLSAGYFNTQEEMDYTADSIFEIAREQ